MSDERYTRKEKIAAAREERQLKNQLAVSEATFTKKIWTIAGAASTFVLVASLSLGVGIGLGTGSLTGGGSTVASGNSNSGNTNGGTATVDPNAAANGVENLTKGTQSKPANAASNAFVFTGVGEIIKSDAGVGDQEPVDNKDKVDLKIYLDYGCSYCKIFEDVESNNIKTALQQGDVTVSYNIMSFLGNYSNAAGSAAACVATHEPERWDEAHLALFAGQEGGKAFTTDGAAGGYVKNLLAPLKLKDETMSCVSELRYVDWLAATTQKFFSTPQDSTGKLIQGTPAVVADGTLYSGEDFRTVGNLTGILQKHRDLNK